MRQYKALLHTAFLFLMLAAAACNCLPETDSQLAATVAAINFQLTLDQQLLEALTTTPTAAASATNTPDATDAPSEPTPTEEPAEALRQWAASAAASSQWSDESGAAIEASGAPDVTECVDQHEAWATRGSNEVADLTLDYATPVVPTQINIYQTWHPDAVSQVTLIDANGDPHPVYTATPTLLEDGTHSCPYILSIDISGITIHIVQVVVTIDQTNFDTWNEIDAVELVGFP